MYMRTSQKKRTKSTFLKELFKLSHSLLWVILIAILIRSCLFAPFHVPSGSMKSTLLIGDYIFANKHAYGYSKYSFPLSLAPIKDKIFASPPQRGDVVIFKPPSNDSIHFIKRIIGLPNDKIQIKLGIVYINDVPVKRRRVKDFIDNDKYSNSVIIPRYEETLSNNKKYSILIHSPNSTIENTKVYNVPEEHFFVMGDNRDESKDSRFSDVGFIPSRNIIGKASFVLFSKSSTTNSIIPFTLKPGRFFKALN